VELFLFPGASIVGRVRDSDDKPVAGALIRAESEGAFTGGAPRTEVSSATGDFVVPGLTPATYRLHVRHKDYAPSVVGDVVVRRESEAAADVVLSAGGRVAGRLVDGEGRPLRGRAALLEIDGQPPSRSLADLLSGEADADGRYRLSAVPPGSHVLALSAPGHSVTKVDVRVRDGQDTDLGETALEVGLAIRGVVRAKTGGPIPDATVGTAQVLPGMTPFVTQAEPDGTFTLAGVTPGRHSLRAAAPGYAEVRRQAEAGGDAIEFVLSPAGTLTGTVVDDAGKPVESFRAAARGANPTGPSQPSSFQSRSFGTGDGRFSLDLNAEGPHTVEIAAPNHATASVSNVQVVLGQTVEVGRIKLSAGGSVRGVVVDSGGGAIPGATVTVRGAGRDQMGGLGPQGTSDASGTFTVSGVTPGTVEVVAVHPSFAEGRASGLEVDPAKGPAEARVVMTVGGRIDGVARKRDGTGLAGQTVSLMFAQPGLMTGGPQLHATADDGTFTIEHVRPGRVRVMLMGGNRSLFTSTQEREVEVREGEATSVEFVLKEILLSGRITRNGEAAAGVRLTLAGTGMNFLTMSTAGPDQGAPTGPQRMRATTGPDGHYEMIATESGKLRLTAQTADARTSLPMRMVDVPDVDAHVVNVDFAGAILSGVVVDKETGQPKGDVRVSAMLRKPQPGPSVREGQTGGGNAMSGADGTFRLELEPAAYRVEARVTGYTPASIEVDVPAEGLADAKLALSKGAALEGKVLDERGRGVGGLSVFASIPPVPAPPGETRFLTSSGGAQTTADGSFVIEGLLQRPHLVVARSNLGAFAIQSGVSPGEKDLALVLKPGGTLQVVVLGPDGAPVQGALVQVMKFNGSYATGLGAGMTSGAGTAELAVPSADLEIRASKEKLAAIENIIVGAGGTSALELRLSAGPVKVPER
jgi:hypothetical protein